jgi:hypothetical protein
MNCYDKCEIYSNKERELPALLDPIITTGLFWKWGINFMTCNPPSSNGHKYIIFAVNYFTKWAEAMPTFNNTVDTTIYFFFNHIISHFGFPLWLVSDHWKHSKNEIFVERSSQPGFSHEFASPYYPQSNGQVKAVNKVLKPCYNTWLTNIIPIVMQEHRPHQASVGASTTHFEHMLNCVKNFEEWMHQI